MNNPTIDDYIITGPNDVSLSVRQLLMCIIPSEQPTHNPACTIVNVMTGKGSWGPVRNFTPSCPGYIDALLQLPRAISLVMGKEMTYKEVKQDLDVICNAAGSPHTDLICEKFSLIVLVHQCLSTKEDCPE